MHKELEVRRVLSRSNWDGSPVTSISLGATPACGVTASQFPPDVVFTTMENPSPGTELPPGTELLRLKLCDCVGAPVLCPEKVRLEVETWIAGRETGRAWSRE